MLTTLQGIDYGIMIVYLIFVLGVGFALKKLMKSSDDFFLSGRSIPAWITGLAFISAKVSVGCASWNATPSARPNQISTALPAASAGKVFVAGSAKFFSKNLLRRRIFLGMKGARLQARQTELAQPFADRAFRHRDRKPARHFIAQVDTTPTDHAILCGSRTFDHQRLQFGHLGIAQGGGCLPVRIEQSPDTPSAL